MKFCLFISFALTASAFRAAPRFRLPIQTLTRMSSGESAGKGEVPTTVEGWRTILDPNQFAVLREKSTEPSGFSERTAGQLEHTLKSKYGSKYPKE
ncbi:hypothetical protein B484DRAFT_394042, partial [Ochromonadaceae sp. CCMP2298]